MKRHSGNGGQRNHGERELSAAARAAIARSSGLPSAGSVPRSPYTTPRRKVRSFFYRIFYGSIISGSPTQQSDKARTLFRLSLIGCLFFFYIPLMGVGYMLVNRVSSNKVTQDKGGMEWIQLRDLAHQSFHHGSFFLGQTSHELPIPRKLIRRNTWNPTQKKLLNDEEIHLEVEKERCERYGLGYTNEAPAHRRRLFLGSLIAGEPMEVLQAIGTEAYNIFHTVSFIESNATSSWNHGLQSQKLMEIHQLFGPNTKVSVDYYVSALDLTEDASLRDALQREGHNLRWKINGMTKEDVAIVADSDTTFSRDFLRALQTCDFPEFRPGGSCSEKVAGVTLTFEGSPTCVGEHKTWFHPGAVLGECVDQIGDTSSHPSAKREWRGMHSNRKGPILMEKEPGSARALSYPLWYATDIHVSEMGKVYKHKMGSTSGYHFHKFQEVQQIHSNLSLGEVDCYHGSKDGTFWSKSASRQHLSTDGVLPFASLPIFYLNEESR